MERILRMNPITGEVIDELSELWVYPASHYVTSRERMEVALGGIEIELADRLADLEEQGKLLEAQRLRMRTSYDLEMMREIGFCSGIENYSRHLDGRSPGEAPFTLLDYFPDDYLTVIDESHVTIPQIHGQYAGDRSRKDVLVEHGFRLPSAIDNRPLAFEEWYAKTNQAILLSATPSDWERRESSAIVEQIIRPTGLVDPEVIVRPTKGQIDDLVGEVRERAANDQRVLVTTLTKKMSEDLADYLLEMGLRARYLHSEIDTLERVQILRDLRVGEYDVLVGINLLREGLDLPEVSLVAILDADKEGFLRSETSLVQTIGRAARNVDGAVVMYADAITNSMRRALDETNRRRARQLVYNEEHGIDPQTIRKKVSDILELIQTGDAPAGDRRARELRRREPPRSHRARPAPAHPEPGGGDARIRRRPAFRIRGTAERRDQRAETRAARARRRRLLIVSSPPRSGGDALRRQTQRRGGIVAGPPPLGDCVSSRLPRGDAACGRGKKKCHTPSVHSPDLGGDGVVNEAVTVPVVREIESIYISGAREHNLRDLHLELPRGSLIVFTGLSGSGKSSLAFDTIYAEGQRRYVESLSA